MEDSDFEGIEESPFKCDPQSRREAVLNLLKEAYCPSGTVEYDPWKAILGTRIFAEIVSYGVDN